MASGKKKVIIICLVSIAVICGIVYSVVKYNQKHRDVLKDAQVVVTIDDDNAVMTELEQIDAAEDQRLKEERGFGVVSNGFDMSGTDNTTTDSATSTESDEISDTEPQEDNSDTSTDSTETVAEEPEIEYTFSYDTITQDNYVNFIEQLCSIDFEQGNVDTSVIPMDSEVRTFIESQGCVDRIALDNGFITMDNGFNDEKNSFFVILHTPNQGTNYIMVEGVIHDGILADITVTEME